MTKPTKEMRNTVNGLFKNRWKKCRTQPSTIRKVYSSGDKNHPCITVTGLWLLKQGWIPGDKFQITETSKDKIVIERVRNDLSQMQKGNNRCR